MSPNFTRLCQHGGTWLDIVDDRADILRWGNSPHPLPRPPLNDFQQSSAAPTRAAATANKVLQVRSPGVSQLGQPLPRNDAVGLVRALHLCLAAEASTARRGSAANSQNMAGSEDSKPSSPPLEWYRNLHRAAPNPWRLFPTKKPPSLCQHHSSQEAAATANRTLRHESPRTPAASRTRRA
jgi:hypothetical protein